jgi:hypothetical protein
LVERGRREVKRVRSRLDLLIKIHNYPCLGIESQRDGCLPRKVTDVLIKIFTWFAFLSITSTILLVGVSGWIYFLKKLRGKAE